MTVNDSSGLGLLSAFWVGGITFRFRPALTSPVRVMRWYEHLLVRTLQGWAPAIFWTGIALRGGEDSMVHSVLLGLLDSCPPLTQVEPIPPPIADGALARSEDLLLKALRVSDRA